ncbi:MAG: ABC transporter permease, partial [Lachnospiraceae bacterium]|nr:ABC transporter permease [Lachnospiraceae bacterium]
MNKRKMYIRMITASLLRRRSRMIIALLAIAIGATILSGLMTIYIDVPRQMRAQFRNYGANMIFTASDQNIAPEDVEKAVALIPASEIVGVAPYRYETVRINDRPVLAAATDMEGAKAASPFWRVEGEWPSADGEIMIGKNVAETYMLRVGSRT